jgi:Icc-related predicted phosphoesterase
VPPCDLLLIAGDICPRADQRAWLDTDFRAWLRTIPAAHVVATWGNNDLAGQRGDVPDLPCTFLVDEVITHAALRIYGAPWSTGVSYQAWALQEEEDLLEGLSHRVPPLLDVLVSHIPPFGVLDEQRGISNGSRVLLSEIERVRPHVTLCGHVHSARGLHTFPWGGQVHNVAARDSAGTPRRDPIVRIEVPRRR